jgi:hypothetical protein
VLSSLPDVWTCSWSGRYSCADAEESYDLSVYVEPPIYSAGTVPSAVRACVTRIVAQVEHEERTAERTARLAELRRTAVAAAKAAAERRTALSVAAVLERLVCRLEAAAEREERRRWRRMRAKVLRYFPAELYGTPPVVAFPMTAEGEAGEVAQAKSEAKSEADDEDTYDDEDDEPLSKRRKRMRHRRGARGRSRVSDEA